MHGTSLAIHCRVAIDLYDAMRSSIVAEPTPSRLSNRSDATPRRESGDSRPWPRCEPALTHFELGASSEYRPTNVMAKRYTPRYGTRKE